MRKGDLRMVALLPVRSSGGKKHRSKREPQQQAASNSFQNSSSGRLPDIVSKVYVPSAYAHLCLPGRRLESKRPETHIRRGKCPSGYSYYPRNTHN